MPFPIVQERDAHFITESNIVAVGSGSSSLKLRSNGMVAENCLHIRFNTEDRDFTEKHYSTVGGWLPPLRSTDEFTPFSVNMHATAFSKHDIPKMAIYAVSGYRSGSTGTPTNASAGDSASTFYVTWMHGHRQTLDYQGVVGFRNPGQSKIAFPVWFGVVFQCFETQDAYYLRGVITVQDLSTASVPQLDRRRA